MSEQPSSTFALGTTKYQVDRYPAKNGATKRPAIVMLHGVDGMGGESGTEIGKFAEQIAADGFVVFVPHYDDVNPARRNHTFLPGGKADMDARSRAVAWMKKHV